MGLSFLRSVLLRRNGPTTPPHPPGKERSSRRLLWWLGSVSLLLLVGVVLAYGYARYLNSSPGNVRLYRFAIEPGATARQIGEHLERDQIIRSASFFTIAARLMEFDRRIHAGTHWVDGSLTTLAVLRHLLSGGLQITVLTIPEGLTVRETAAVIATQLPVEPDSLVALAYDSLYVHLYGFPGASSLEGFLFPDTYFLDAGADPHSVIGTMARRFHDLFTDDMKARTDTLNMRLIDILTLASIIEKEAMAEGERPVISQVFHRRLALGYKLGADPTVKYVMDKDPRRLSLRDIEIDSPYNTYRYAGLPPGPICSPGIGAIRAALWPADGDYLYFVSNWDGTHTFTKSLREHNLAKAESNRRYREWRTEQRRRATQSSAASGR